MNKKFKNTLKSVFVQQVGTTAISQAAMLLLSLATAAITARWLGPEGKGELAMVFMVPAMLQLFLCAGLGPANVYYVGSNRIPVRQLAQNSVAFSLMGTLIGFVLIFLFLKSNLLGALLPGVSSGYLLLVMLALPLGLLSSNLSAILHGLQRILTLNVLNIARSSLSVVLMAVFLIWLELGLPGAIFATLAVQLIVFLVIAFYAKREGAGFRPRWNLEVVKPTFGYGVKGYISNLFQFFNYRLDFFIVNYFLGPAEVGIYGVSVTIAELLWQLPNAASFVILPKSVNSSQAEMNRFTPRVFLIIFCITFLGAIGLALFGRPFILMVFSSAFLGAYIPLLVLLPGVVLLGSCKVLANDIGGRGFPHYNSINSGLSFVATVIFDLLLIPKMGVVGAALASTLSYILGFVLAVIFYISVARKASLGNCASRA